MSEESVRYHIPLITGIAFERYPPKQRMCLTLRAELTPVSGAMGANPITEAKKEERRRNRYIIVVVGATNYYVL